MVVTAEALDPSVLDLLEYHGARLTSNALPDVRND